jgi:hypothetical protein
VAVTSVIVRNANATAVDFYERLRDNGTLIALLLVLGVAMAAVIRLRRDSGIRPIAVALLFALVTFVSLTPARYIGINQTGEFMPDGRSELLGYQAAYDMSRLLEELDEPPSRVLLWTTLSGYPMIGWTNLPHQFSSIESPSVPLAALNQLSPDAIDLARHPTTDALLLLSQDPADMSRGVHALASAGLGPVITRQGQWADGDLHYRLVDLPGPLRCCNHPDDDDHAAAVVAQAYLSAYRRRDASAICGMVAPEVELAIAAGQPSCGVALQSQLAASYPRLSIGATHDVPSPAGNPRIAVAVREQPGREVLVGRYGSIWRVVDGGKPPEAAP